MTSTEVNALRLLVANELAFDSAHIYASLTPSILFLPGFLRLKI